MYMEAKKERQESELRENTFSDHQYTAVSHMLDVQKDAYWIPTDFI